MKYVYYNDCIISAPQVAMRFIKTSEPGICRKDYNTNERIFEVTYSEGSTFDQISGVEILSQEPPLIDLEGDIKLFEKHTVNNLTFYLRHNSEYPGRVWSCFINYEASQLSYNENNIGGWLIYPSVDISSDLTNDILELINTNSDKFFIKIEEGLAFKVSNIQAVDMLEQNILTDFDDIIPYGDYPKLYLTEADIIYGFIQECKKQFPEIEFFPQSSERKNKGKESIYYHSQISQERSTRFSSNIIDDAERGKLVQTTIPIEMYYQTADIQQYIHRRDSYLLSNFLMNVHNFTVTKERGYPDRFGDKTEVFHFSTYWDRNSVQNDVQKGDVPDGSGRDGYNLIMLCDLIGFIIEKTQYVNKIDQVITSIYVSTNTDQDSNIVINTFTLPENLNKEDTD